ncbi:peptide deformylase [Lacticigenium naphthae]|uniref:peptide deformylase n=1 Tax=Lacticigenium naphthae TaxID=515351 RepID=UPI00040F8A96|nr:peptide deformylase [Lacticigenium naphthae]
MLTMKDIIREGHPTLRKVSEKIERPLSEEIISLGQEMIQFLQNSQTPELEEKYDLRPGVGLAAPQLNILKRIIAVHIPSIEEDGEPELSAVMINPKIISHSVKQSCLGDGEGCLSVDREVPGYVPRASKVTISYIDLKGNDQKIRLRDYPAIVVQHEIDHLNGVMFYDRINEDHPFEVDEDTIILG